MAFITWFNLPTLSSRAAQTPPVRLGPRDLSSKRDVTPVLLQPIGTRQRRDQPASAIWLRPARFRNNRSPNQSLPTQPLHAPEKDMITARPAPPLWAGDFLQECGSFRTSTQMCGTCED